MASWVAKAAFFDYPFGEHEAMSDDQKQRPPTVTAAQIARRFLAIILFGVLMGIRGDVASIWIRMLVAACAGAALVIGVLPLRKP